MSDISAAQPFWSVMITSYNRALVKEAMASVLAQDQGAERMQIEVVDDASPDVDMRSLVEEFGKGRVGFHRNERNLGLYGNCNVAVKRARGRWVHILHDDDVVYPGFYKAMEAADQAGEFEGKAIGAAFCRPDNIDENGKSLGAYVVERETAGPLANFAWRSIDGNPVLFPSMVVKKSVYETLNGFIVEVGNAADWVMWARIAQAYAVWYEPRVLAGYRRHSGSVSSELFRSAADIAGITQALAYFEKMLPPTLQAQRMLASVRESVAMVALGNSRESFNRGDLFAGTNHIRQGFLCSSTARVSRELEKGVMRNWDAYVRSSVLEIQKFSARPDNPLQANVARALRYNVANQIMDAEASDFKTTWTELSPLAETLLYSPLRELPLDSPDVTLVNSTLVQLQSAGDGADGKWLQRVMLAALFCHPVQIAFPLHRFPEWLVLSYLKIMLALPKRFPSPQPQSEYDEVIGQLRMQVMAQAANPVPVMAATWHAAAALFAPPAIQPSFHTVVGPWLNFS